MSEKKAIKKNRKCYYCKEVKPLSDMEEMGVWVCKKCLKK
jgi:ribosomal protein L37AE/L43A